LSDAGALEMKAWSSSITLTRRVATLATVGLVCFAATASGSAPALPTPGSPSVVASQVKASTAINVLPTALVPALINAPNDKPGLYYPSSNKACYSVTQCVYGDLTSKTVVVLYGDSHAQMWLPPLVAVALAQNFRLVLIWHPGCAVANIPFIDAECKTFRTTAISEITPLNANLVLLADRTSDIVAPGGKQITDEQWQIGLEDTIKALATKTTKVAVIGDISQMDSPIPACLAINPTKIQACSVYNPNPKFTNRFKPEKAAAKATNATYINPQPWLCTKKCSPVIGNFVVYFDQGHVTSTYAEYLTNMWAPIIKKLL
jgi:hypothetical protein